MAFAVALVSVGIAASPASAETTRSQDASQLKSHGRTHATRRHRQPKTKPVVASTDDAAPAPRYLSDAWVKREKQADDKLKRTMVICKGC